MDDFYNAEVWLQILLITNLQILEHRLLCVCMKVDEYHSSESWIWSQTGASSNPGVATC